MDESERYKLGEFDDCAAAIAACQEIVDEFLVANRCKYEDSGPVTIARRICSSDGPHVEVSTDEAQWRTG